MDETNPMAEAQAERISDEPLVGQVSFDELLSELRLP